MDMIASTLLAFPPGANLDCFGDNASYNTSVKAHVSKLSKLLQDQNAELIDHGPDLLDILDPAINSLSYLAVLHTLVFPGLVASVPRDLILEKLVLFLVTFDARQCRYARSHLHDVFLAAGNGQYLPPSAAVEALATAILRLDPTGSLLTTSHIILTKLAYSTNIIEPSLPVIDKDIVFFPGMANYGEPKYLCDLTLPPPAYLSRETGLTGTLKPSLVLEYDLLRGMMYCSERNWTKAFDAFEQVVSFPTREGGTSKIMIDAYKKWVLVSLLSKGKLDEPQSYTGVAASKLYGNLGKPYQAVAILFVTDNVQALKTEVEKNNQLWAEDGNTGLIQEVLAAYQKWRVLGLEQIYSKVSLPEIRQQTTSAETGKVLEKDEDIETLIQNMIISGMLNGVIEKNDDGTSFLTFLSPSTLLSEEDFASQLGSTALRLKQLHSFFKTTRERLGTSKEYIKYIIKEEKRIEKNEPDPTIGFDAQVDDEDLMGGVVATG
ncbi:uncharacterized protein GGS22DRAFT_131988 [Annulohypoxylon maeteangense]|uniref:uncharacterized protein n=1 Tax=Annulohypoxylon maeteangense TaxID=1927788 RepID=UPI0020076745|nr:uncharacterized protein GGS22DRAFT_131988 [Annulohypoxylon maeteangense]KAI0885654.1 hypothetical protein GGS22DRAFT_131988 [Annulohypoxylon maeteangense]